MKIVVDTNIVFSAILNSESWIGQILLHSDKSVKFYSPHFLQVEIQNHFQKIKKITKQTLHLNFKLWTGDKVLSNALFQKGFKKFISTQELIEKLKK